MIRKLCHRQCGIGSDGIILLEHSERADFRMRIFNSDGSEAEMCGNGLRCLGFFLKELNIPGDSFLIQAMERQFSIKILAKRVQIHMGLPRQAEFNKKISVDAEAYTCDFLNTGVPHTVIMSDNIESVDLANVGRKIRYHPCFSPHGTNVNFVSFPNENSIHVRTYERGVEQETLACGTGATAAAIAVGRQQGYGLPIRVIPRSGEEILFTFIELRNELKDVIMEGPASFIFRGSCNLTNFY